MKKSETFHIIGIDTRTSNQEGKAAQDIPALWNRFLSQNLMEQVPNKVGAEIFCIYTEYEGDHNLPYTALLGCKVDNLDNVPEGMRGMTFTTQKLEKFTTKGNLQQGAVWQKWLKIWEEQLDRTYSFDFEVYGEKAQNPEAAEVDIYISVN
ncbi:MAG: GyrI-like domain-containing protein [Saprospiraceae bacterium]